MRIVLNIKPVSKAGRSNAQVVGGTVTYNEAGITYNEPGYIYGGLDQRSEYIPIMGVAQVVRPSIVFSGDIGTVASGTVTRVLHRGMSMGLLLALTYPEDGTVTIII